MGKTTGLWSVAGLVLALLAACGGGGGGGSAAPGPAPAPSVPSSAFVAGSAAEQAYFSDSYDEFASPALSGSGYIRNATDSAGNLNRTRYDANVTSGGYAAAPATSVIFQVGNLGTTTSALLDLWMITSGGTVRSAGSGSFVLNLSRADWFTIAGIREVDVSGQPFSSYLSALALNGHGGVFPAGAKAYTAVWTSTQDIYLAQNSGSLMPGTASVHYLSDRYTSASQAYCLNSTRGLVFSSPTQATSYPLLTRNGTSCTVDTTAGGVVHSVSSKQMGDFRLFDFTNNQLPVTDFTSTFFGASGTSTQRFAVVLGQASSGVVEHASAYVFPAGSQGAFLAASGVRLNKVAMNAVLAAASLPAIP
jgi:hypothetical protein